MFIMICPSVPFERIVTTLRHELAWILMVSWVELKLQDGSQ